MKQLLALVARFNPAALRALGWALLTGLLLSVAAYFWRHIQLAHANWQQQQTTAQHAALVQASAGHHTAYQLDSTRQATERAELQRQATTLAQEDEALSTSRPARIELPAEPPREQSN